MVDPFCAASLRRSPVFYHRCLVARDGSCQVSSFIVYVLYMTCPDYMRLLLVPHARVVEAAGQSTTDGKGTNNLRSTGTGSEEEASKQQRLNLKRPCRLGASGAHPYRAWAYSVDPDLSLDATLTFLRLSAVTPQLLYHLPFRSTGHI